MKKRMYYMSLGELRRVEDKRFLILQYTQVVIV